MLGGSHGLTVQSVGVLACKSSRLLTKIIFKTLSEASTTSYQPIDHLLISVPTSVKFSNVTPPFCLTWMVYFTDPLVPWLSTHMIDGVVAIV